MSDALMPTTLDALEAAARLATSGPWEAGTMPADGTEITGKGTLPFYIADCGDKAHVYRREFPEAGEAAINALADATYIAAASPDVILHLIAVVRAAEAYRDRVGDARTDIDVLCELETLNAAEPSP